MKKIFLFIMFLCSGFLYAQIIETLNGSGHSVKSGSIEYYENGLIKSFSYGDVSCSCSVLEQSDNFINANVKWIIYGSTYESILDIQISSDSIKFNSSFNLPQKNKNENDIKISGKTFSNSDFYINLDSDNFNYKTGKQNWIKKNNSIFDKNSFGKIESGVFIRPLARVINYDKRIIIGKYNCYEFNAGGFTYDCDEKISFTQVIDKENISDIYKFLNFYLVSTELDPSVLPFIFLFSRLNKYKQQNSIISYESDSYLVEKDTIYSAENLSSITELPWASANGYGIGDTINLFIDINEDLNLTLYNGFQSEKEYLYNQNSRVKRIEITNLDTNKKNTYTLKDSPEKQTIHVQENAKHENQVGRFSIKILEVYPGSKYKDLCIQAIIAE